MTKQYEAKIAKLTQDAELISESFFFTGTNGRAVLLIHGWSSTPYEMRSLANQLHKNGYTVYAPLLRGHGSEPEDLEGLRWQDWRQDVICAYDKLEEDYENVSVGGMSTGGSLALHLVIARPQVGALILMGTPHTMRFEWIGHLITRILMCFRPYKKKYYPPILGSEKGLSQLISYQRYPYKSALEAYYAIKAAITQLSQVTQPCMLIQSRSDHLVSRKSMQSFASQLGSDTIHMRMISRAYHNFIGDEEHSYIYDEIGDFIDHYSGGSIKSTNK